MEERINQLIEAIDERPYVREVIGALFLPISLLYMEIVAKSNLFGGVFDDKYKYMMFLSLAMGCLLSVVAMLIPGKPRRIFMKTVLAVLAVWFSFHVSYYGNFHTFFSWQTLGQAKDVTQFWRESIVAVFNVWFVIVALFVPLVIMCLTGKYFVTDDLDNNIPYAGIAFVAFIVFYFPMLVAINSSKNDTNDYTPYYYYTYLQNDLDTSFQYYGIFNTTRLDIKQLMFGAPEETFDNGNVTDPDAVLPGDKDNKGKQEEEKEYGYNVMNIDFDKAAKNAGSTQLKNMDNYFKTVQPTQKNKYTGMFKDKNLIFITLEGFSDKIIDPEFTPTLYKMSTEGFVFKNFYNSIWGGSTATGEYSCMTGNFYTTANCLKLSGSKYQPFALGNQFKKLGYTTLAYHNNSYTYYGRDKSHPNFGYTWKATNHGLTLQYNGWPRSDKEMAEVSSKDFVGLGHPFHVYYMSVSGHANYTFSGNSMSSRHRKDLPEKLLSKSEGVQAYNACQYEVELMLKALIDALEASGELENTVFAIAEDHYPYALSDADLATLYGIPKEGIRNNFDLYRNGFLLWSASMTQPVIVDKPCSAIDILPTLSNLFGLEYDSRLLMGSDILADGDHFALIKVNGWSWISTQGEYNASAKRFTPSANCTLSDSEKTEYVNAMNKIVRAKQTYSKQLLDKDYYRHIYKFISKEKIENTEQEEIDQP